MSAAAETYVQTVPVKGSARALLYVIASLIPEGETITAPISIEDLTARMTGYGDAAARRPLRRLVALGVVRIVGAVGQTSSYELPSLAGARWVHPPLPLLGEAPPPRARRVRSPEGPTLFDSPMLEVSTDVTMTPRTKGTGWRHPVLKVQGRRWHLVPFVPGWVGRLLKNVTTQVQKVRGWRSNSEPPRTKGTGSPPDASLDRARDVRTTTTTRTTTTREATDAPAVEPDFPVHPWHAWCGRMCVPKEQHAEFLQRLGRLPNEPAPAQDARAFACYAAELATIPIEQPITARNHFDFWRPRFTAMLATAARPPVEPSADREAETLAAYAALFRQAIEARLTRRDLDTWITPLVVLPTEEGVVLCAPSELHATFVRHNFREALEAATQAAFHCPAEVIVRAPARSVSRNP